MCSDFWDWVFVAEFYNKSGSEGISWPMDWKISWLFLNDSPSLALDVHLASVTKTFFWEKWLIRPVHGLIWKIPSQACFPPPSELQHLFLSVWVCMCVQIYVCTCHIEKKRNTAWLPPGESILQLLDCLHISVLKVTTCAWLDLRGLLEWMYAF